MNTHDVSKIGFPESSQKLRTYGYVRLSRDEDSDMLSLTNQKQILFEYAQKVGLNLMGIFEDDNVSGMHFDREGIQALRDEARKGNIDVILAKDLSRIGRHKTLCALFLEEMKELDIRVFSVTENLDSLNENDDIIISIKQIFNDQYSKDLSRKIKTGYKQKQKEGIVMTPPYGLSKDKNTGHIYIDDECATVVKKIFELYRNGNGIKKIAKILSERGIYTPSHQHKIKNGRSFRDSKESIWSDTTISRILSNDAYIGVLRNGVTTKAFMKKQNKKVPESEQFVHEDYYPAIIDNDLWIEVQAIRKNRVTNNVRASSQSKVHRYAGLLICADCGASFVAKRRTAGTKKGVEYVCNGYHRYGTKVCTPHRIREEILDSFIYNQLDELKTTAKENLKQVDHFIRGWNNKRKDYDYSIIEIQHALHDLKSEIKEYAIQNAKGLIRNELFEELSKEIYIKIDQLENQISMQNKILATNKNANKGIVHSIDVINDILEKKMLTNSQLQLLINKIHINEKSKNEIELHFILNIPFKSHLQYENKCTDDIKLS